MASPKFERLIRFEDPSGKVHLGELPKDHPWDAPLEGVVAQLYNSVSPLDEDLELYGQTAEVKRVLSPLPDVPFIYGVGFNYRRHAEEGDHKLPPYPKTFVKYSDVMTGPYDDDVVVHPTATEIDCEVRFDLIVIITESIMTQVLSRRSFCDSFTLLHSPTLF